MQSSSVKVDIICPKCGKKAVFHSRLIGTYKLHPGQNGKMTCTHCGFNSNHTFSGKDYYYKVQVGERTLYAQTLDKLVALRDYFKNYDENKDHHNPETDFPKTFYARRKELIRKIDELIDELSE